MANFTKQAITKELAKLPMFASQAAAKGALEATLAIITRELGAGNNVGLGKSFGNLHVSRQAPRAGSIQNVPYDVQAKNVVKFRPSTVLKTKVAGN